MPSSIDGSVVGVTNGGMMLAAAYNNKPQAVVTYAS